MFSNFIYHPLIASKHISSSMVCICLPSLAPKVFQLHLCFLSEPSQSSSKLTPVLPIFRLSSLNLRSKPFLDQCLNVHQEQHLRTARLQVSANTDKWTEEARASSYLAQISNFLRMKQPVFLSVLSPSFR